jgi:hypothetical protein
VSDINGDFLTGPMETGEEAVGGDGDKEEDVMLDHCTALAEKKTAAEHVRG